MLVEKIAKLLQKRRKELGITQPHLAELAQLSPNTIYKLEKGKGNPTIEILEKVIDVLGVEINIQVKK